MTRPNLLLLFTDQETAVTAGLPLATPARDRLAAEGVRFAQAYCVTPQCSPSRAAFLTGLYPHQTGVRTNVDAELGRPLSPEHLTLGRHFQATGYTTAYFGKWHLGGAAGAGPERHGFDHVWTRPGHGEIDEALTQRCCDWLAHPPAEPWLLVASFGNPHDIYGINRRNDYPIRPGVALPASWDDDLTTKPAPQAAFLHEDQGRPFAGAAPERWRQYRSLYSDLIERTDAQLARILAALDAGGQRARTAVGFFSDHGDMVGAHGLPFKGPFLYEEQLRVPLTLSWPGRLPLGAVCDEVVSLLDLFPTLCDLAGVEPPAGLAGRSLVPLLAGGGGRNRGGEGGERGDDGRHPGGERRGEPGAGAGERELLFQYLSKQRWTNPIRGLRTGRWKLVEYLEGGLELYELERDPAERVNLALDPAHAGLLGELRRRLAQKRRALGDCDP